jgi:FKBP-type peptidyl-prolyl cis-trans isomerase FklB
MKINYSTGYQIGSDFDRQGIKFAPKFLIQGILDAEKNSELLMELKEIRSSLGKLHQQATNIEQQKFADIALNNKKQGEQFLLENRSKKGIIELPSGLQYQLVKRGKGVRPRKRDFVTVRYRGILLDGTEIDNTLSQEDGVKLRVDQVIKGWSEALIKMAEGARWRLFIPSYLGFGDHAFGKKIPPNSTLIYDVELLKVN